MLRRLGGIAALGAVYFVAAAAAIRLLASSPPTAVAVWPAAGLALGALLRFGRGLWPGVLLGALAAAAVHRPGGSVPSARGAALALSLAAAVTLQAYLGAVLVGRFVPRWRTLDEDRSIAAFLIVAGPLGCIPSATIGSVTLLTLGSLTPVELPFHWWSWFVGDVIGVLIFAPMILVWNRPLGRQRAVSVTVVLTAAFTLVLALFIRVERWEQNRFAIEGQRRVEQVAEVLERELAQALDAVEATADLCDAFEILDRGGFRRFVERALRREPSLAFMAWLPRAGDGAPLVPEVVRSPGAPGLEAIDLDLRARTVTEAERTGRSLIRPLGGGALLLVAPQAGARGATAALARLDQPVTRAWTGQGGLELATRDGGRSTTVYESGGRTPAAAVTHVAAFQYGGQEWQVRAALSGGERAQERGWQSWMVLAAGMLFLALLEGFLLLVTGRATRVESLVAQRTVELEASRRSAQEQRSALARSNTELAAALAAKEVLLRELHHRVKNNLQVISSLFSLQARYLPDPRYREIFEESRNRVFSIALAHEKLYRSKDLARIDFSEYARNLIDHLHSMFGAGGSIKVETEIHDVTLPVETAIPCGLVVNELVTNAFKHAFPGGRRGTIRVVLREAMPERWLVAVEDDGVGLPPHIELGRTESLGLDLVSILAAQLAAKVEIEREGGTRFRLTFGRDRRLDA